MSREIRDPAAAQAAAPGVRIRAFEAADLPAAATAAAAALGVDTGDAESSDRWRKRVGHPLRTDPDGAFVAERDGRVIGVAQALRRERLWCLSLLAVHPEEQIAGVGRALLARALAYSGGTEAGLITSSSDPRALRLYGLAGFALLPTFEAAGAIDRDLLPRPDPEIREGDLGDLEALAPISRDIRGGPHTLELEFALGLGGRLRRGGVGGSAAPTPGHGLWLLVAYDETAAASLLWSALALAEPAERPPVRWITADQQWAIEVLLRARLRLTPSRALCVRGRPGPLRPFLPSGPFA